MEDVTYLPRTCPQCRRPLTGDAPEGLCAACLLVAATESLTRSTLDDALTVTSVSGSATPAQTDTPQLDAGQTWGPYHIGRLLGRGGMGEVHEAEHVDTGRRIALKVLRRRLQDADDRARFLREGQLAASVSHPHTVYIFGSEEIAGVPVISMELLPGGTLKDRVVSEGPLPPAIAVSAVLDIIGGLDAAQAAGILHRDIKPSNCFVDIDGSVKVGDFGLSISTLARDVRQQLATGFEGTPQFAAPEQLRGEPLDVRADIYAVGATLYYLLIGQPVFEASDLQELVNRVNTEPPRSPRLVRPEIPRGLAAVVLRCLSKAPAERPASYTVLAEALRPFSTLDEKPAVPGQRLLAGILDVWILSVPISVWRAVTGDITVNGEPIASTSPWTWLLNPVYFFILEAWWGASLGKRLLGLRLSSSGGAGWAQRVARRTIVFHIPWLVVSLAIVAFGPFGPKADRSWGNVTLKAKDTRDLIEGVGTLTLIAALFLTARRRNGWAGLHDLASDTRVVTRTAARIRRRASTAATPVAAVAAASHGPRYGPFAALSDAGDESGSRVVIGFDPVLRRRVWIEVVPARTPPISATRRDVSRTGRLHWLTGRRSATENWDAYEAPDGRALLAPGEAALEWGTLKLWLVDLASELSASANDGSTPALRLDRVWVRDDGRLVLLDFPAPGLDAGAGQGASADLTPVALLSAFASHALSASARRTILMPLSARTLLRQLAQPSPPTLTDVHADLARVAALPDRVWRPRRALPIVGASIPPVFVVAFMLLVTLPMMDRFFGPETQEMLSLLEMLDQPDPPPGSRLVNPEVRQSIEIYIAGRHRVRLNDADFWESPVMRDVSNRLHETAVAVAARHPSVSPDALTRASATIAPELERRQQKPQQDVWSLSGTIVMAVTAFFLLALMALSITSSLIVPGGLLTRLLGHAVVRRDGTEIGRLVSLARVLVAWAPAIVWLLYLAMSPKVQGFVPAPSHPLLSTALMVGALAIGAVFTIARPARGPHDWLVGTWVVPR